MGVSDNFLTNGDFQVWQRGINFSLTDTAYTADRWQIEFPTPYSSPINVTVPTGQAGMRITGPTVTGSLAKLKQTIELFRMRNTNGMSNVVRLRYIARNESSSSIPVNKPIIGSLPASAISQISGPSNYTSTDTLYRFVMSGHFTETDAPIYPLGDLPGDEFDFYIRQIVLTLGATWRTITPSPYADELLACQRYFYRAQNLSLEGSQNYNATGNILRDVDIPYPTTMRVAPTISNITQATENISSQSVPLPDDFKTVYNSTEAVRFEAQVNDPTDRAYITGFDADAEYN